MSTLSPYAVGFFMWWIGFLFGAVFMLIVCANHKSRAFSDRLNDPHYDQPERD